MIQKIKLLLLFSFVFHITCAWAADADLLDTIQTIETRLNQTIGNHQKLDETLDQIQSQLFSLNSLDFKNSLDIPKVHLAIGQLFEIKKSLRASLETLPANYPNRFALSANVKVLLSGIRYFEDYLFEYLKSTATGKSSKKKIYPFSGDDSFVQRKESFKNDLSSLKTGDVILMRAVVFASALIARISEAPQTYSHMAMIWVDPSNSKRFLIEGTLNTGFVKTELTLEKFNGQARAAVYRAKDEKLARLAGEFGNDKYEQGIKSGKPLKYDLELGLEENCKYYCSKFVSWSYNSVTKKETLPEHPSRLRINNPDYVSSLGMPEKSKLTYAPSDIDLDSTFDLVYEFRNPDLTPSARLDDLITDKLLYWQRTENLDLVPGPFYDKAAAIITDLVEKPWIRRILNHLHIHISPEIEPKNLSVLGASTIIVMKLKLAILPEYKAYLEKNGIPMAPKEIYALIDRKRLEKPAITKQLVPRVRKMNQCSRFYAGL